MLFQRVHDDALVDLDDAAVRGGNDQRLLVVGPPALMQEDDRAPWLRRRL